MIWLLLVWVYSWHPAASSTGSGIGSTMITEELVATGNQLNSVHDTEQECNEYGNKLLVTQNSRVDYFVCAPGGVRSGVPHGAQ